MLLQGVEHALTGQVFFNGGIVEGNAAYGNANRIQNHAPHCIQIPAGGQVHHRVCTRLCRGQGLFHFAMWRVQVLRCAHIHIHLDGEHLTHTNRPQPLPTDVSGYDDPSCRHQSGQLCRIYSLALGHDLDLREHAASLRLLHQRH